MKRCMQSFLVAGVLVTVGTGTASAQYYAAAQYGRPAPSAPQMVVVAQPPQMQADLGGGFVEFLFGGNSQPRHAPPPQNFYHQPSPQMQMAPRQAYASVGPVDAAEHSGPPIDPRYLRQEVEFTGSEAPGTIVVDTPNKFLYLVQPGGRALRYGIGVGRPGFTWSGQHLVSAKKEWPSWVPPEEMLERQPYLPRFMPGGPTNPLGARALYLGSTLYRIHGSNEPWTIGQNVSSGCIRMRNADVIDLYNRVNVGAKVVVL